MGPPSTRQTPPGVIPGVSCACSQPPCSGLLRVVVAVLRGAHPRGELWLFSARAHLCNELWLFSASITLCNELWLFSTGAHLCGELWLFSAGIAPCNESWLFSVQAHPCNELWPSSAPQGRTDCVTNSSGQQWGNIPLLPSAPPPPCLSQLPNSMTIIND